MKEERRDSKCGGGREKEERRKLLWRIRKKVPEEEQEKGSEGKEKKTMKISIIYRKMATSRPENLKITNQYYEVERRGEWVQ
jgi:hypothetical protein